MFKRLTLNIVLVLLFAFAQIGAVTHEISHFSPYKQHQQDKNTHGEQCKQCISYAEVAGGLVGKSFALPAINAHLVASTYYNLSSQPALNVSYSARAPPLNT